MNIKRLISDDDAVSPVIGVILMVAITVILAAVIGAFVLGIGGDQESAPQVTWSESEDTSPGGPADYAVNFTHNGGDAIGNAESTLSIAPNPSSDYSTSYPNGFDGNGEANLFNDSRVTAGVELNAAYGSGDVSEGQDVRIIWSPDGSDDTNVIGTFTVTET